MYQPKVTVLKKVCLMTLLIIVMLMGCSASNNQIILEEVTATLPPPQPVSASVADATMTVIEADASTTTSTPTATPTKPTATSESTATLKPTRVKPTPTPFPTFDVAEANISEEVATQNLIELLATNRRCELPCWWGMAPGETEVDSVEAIFVPLGFDWYRDYEELQDNTPYKASIYIASLKNIIQTIQVRGGAGEETYDRNEAWRPYALPEMLKRLGIPTEVYVYYPFRFDPGGMQAYRLFLYYPDLGVEIDYLGKATLLDDQPGWVRACPNILETDEINLFLFQPGMVADYLERTLPVISLPLPELPEGTNPYDVVSWQEATESSLEQFGQLFMGEEEGTVCFDFKTYWTGD